MVACRTAKHHASILKLPKAEALHALQEGSRDKTHKNYNTKKDSEMSRQSLETRCSGGGGGGKQ